MLEQPRYELVYLHVQQDEDYTLSPVATDVVVECNEFGLNEIVEYYDSITGEDYEHARLCHYIVLHNVAVDMDIQVLRCMANFSYDEHQYLLEICKARGVQLPPLSTTVKCYEFDKNEMKICEKVFKADYERFKDIKVSTFAQYCSKNFLNLLFQPKEHMYTQLIEFTETHKGILKSLTDKFSNTTLHQFTVMQYGVADVYNKVFNVTRKAESDKI